MNIKQALSLIESKRNFHFDIKPLKAALKAATLDYLALKCIHIAGTNGKGSTTNYLRASLQLAYPHYKIGTFTSPYLEVHNDRIRINDVFISDNDFVRIFEQYQTIIDAYELSMFEIDMLISIAYFLESKVDLVIYETGLGGLLDATNVIMPIVSVITNIGDDHMEFLGDTIEEVALAKAGIIKPNTPVVTAEQQQTCLDVFNKVAKANNTYLTCVKHFDIINQNPIVFLYQGQSYELQSKAMYQVQNAALTVEIATVLTTLGFNISYQHLQKAFKTTLWKGRFEEVLPNVFIDGAHNKQGVLALCETISSTKKEAIIVFAALKDKPVDWMLAHFKKYAKEVIVTTFDFYRAMQKQDFKENVMVYEDYKSAIDKAIKQRKENQIVVVTGSLYFISEARGYLLGGK